MTERTFEDLSELVAADGRILIGVLQQNTGRPGGGEPSKPKSKLRGLFEKKESSPRPLSCTLRPRGRSC